MFLAIILFALFSLLASAGLFWLIDAHWSRRAAWSGLIFAFLLFATIGALLVWLLSDLSSPPS